MPPGFVVTAAAYRLFAESAPWLVEALDQFDCACPERLGDQCAALRSRLCVEYSSGWYVLAVIPGQAAVPDEADATPT